MRVVRFPFRKIEGLDLVFGPCPFCGGLPEWVEVPGEDFIMRCSCCHASTKEARQSPKEAAADWNAREIEDDGYTVTMDASIDEYLINKECAVRLSECVRVDGGCHGEDAVVDAGDRILLIEAEGGCLWYDELSGYNPDYYLPATEQVLHFVQSCWENDRLVSLTFAGGSRIFHLSVGEGQDDIVVREEE